MSALAKKSREAMQAKARRLAGEKVGKVDSSNWTPPAPMNTAQKFDMPGDPRARATYKRGGAVGKAEGGGNWIKGAIKKPGALHKELGVKEGEKIPEKKIEKAENSKNPLLAKRARLAETLKGMAKKDGGKAERPARASGGKVKGKTNISVNILAGGKPEGAMPAMMPAPGLNPMPAPPPAPAPAAPPPGLPIPNSPMPMGRKAGGRVYRSYKDMDAGACSGEGRLEKTEIQKNKRA